MRESSPEVAYLDEWAPTPWYWLGFAGLLLLFATPCCLILGTYMVLVAFKGRGFVSVLDKWRCGTPAQQEHIL